MTIEDYILSLENSAQADLIAAAHDLIENLIPQVKSLIKWKVPFYEYHKHLCYLNPKKGGGIEIAFIHGALFSNEQGLLQDAGRKQIKGLLIKNLKELHSDAVTEIILEAAAINEELKRDGSDDWYKTIHKK